MVEVELGQLGLLDDVPTLDSLAPDSMPLFAGTTVAAGRIVAAERIVASGRRTVAVLPEARRIERWDFVVEYFVGRPRLDELELGELEFGELELDKQPVRRVVRLEFDTDPADFGPAGFGPAGFGPGSVGLLDLGIAVVGHRTRHERLLSSVQLPHQDLHAEA